MKEASVLASILFIIIALFMIAADVSASPYPLASTPQPTPMGGRVATVAELQKAESEWEHSRHANTFDEGQGANTTCASCKSPRNWDPTAVVAQDQALDCNACKRAPGAPRPALEGGMTVPQEEWHNIGCEICHIPVGNSYLTSIAFWNQSLGQYEPVKNTTELCAKCHEGTHGFEVIEEQTASVAHKGWDCTRCHGAHGSPSACTNCHTSLVGKGAPAHAQHPFVNCTACHDAGNLSIWKDTGSKPKHIGTYITIRFAHTLTSWPSHDLQTTVDCRRCHHPQGSNQATLATQTRCDNAACHPQGAALNWCIGLRRDPAP